MDGTNRLMNQKALERLSEQNRGFLEGLEYVLDIAIPKFEDSNNVKLSDDFKSYLELIYSEYVDSLLALSHGISIRNIMLEDDIEKLSENIIAQVE